MFCVPLDTNNENFVFAKSLLSILRKSGSRITAEARELTKDLNLVVDVLEGSFMHYGKKAHNGTSEDVVTTTIDPISTTTEEESNDIIIKQTNVDSESTTILPETTFEAEVSTTLRETEQTELANQKQHPSSAFSSLLLQKIQEVAKAMKKGRAALEFSTKWTTEQQNHHLQKRQAEMINTTDEAEEITNEVAAPQHIQPDEMNECISRWDLEQHKFSEKKHLDGLQKELEKMEELIEILKQQQRILDNMSAVDEKYYEFLNNSMRAGNIAQQQRLLQLLEVLNSKLSFNSTNATDVEEMVRLKSDVELLKLAVQDLPKRSKEVEKRLFNEVEHQKMEIVNIKNSLRQLIKTEKLALNDSLLQKRVVFDSSSPLYDPMDPHNIRIRIKLVQNKIEKLITERNPDYDELNELYEEIERLQDLVDQSFTSMVQGPETGYQLERQARKLLEMKKIVSDLITKQFKNQKDFFVKEPLHAVHFVTVPKAQKAEKSNVKSQARSTESDEIMRRLIKELAAANDSSTTEVVDPQQAELQKSIKQLQRTIQSMVDTGRLDRDKQKQINFIANRIKTLDNVDFQAKSLSDDEEEKIILKLLKRILQQLERSGRELDDSSDTENELRKLAESIDRLRPKDNDRGFNTENANDIAAAAQLQLLSRLLAEQRWPRPAQTAPLTPQQMGFLINRFNPQPQPPTPFVAPPPPPLPPNRFIDTQPNFTPQQYPTATTNNNLFRDYPKSFVPPQGGYTGPGQQQLDANPEQTYVDAGPYTKQKIEDLKQQIYSLQNAIATLDNPNYVKRPEDEATIYNLEQQITNLKNIVSGLNQYPEEVPVRPDGGYDRTRVRRSVEVGSDEEKLMEQTANFLRNFMPQEETQARSSGSYGNLHQQLLDLEKQLGRIILLNFR